MPIVRVDLLEGRSLAQKRKLAEAITDAVVEHADVAASQVRVVFTDHAPEDWAIAGELVSDRRAKAAADAAKAGLDGAAKGTKASSGKARPHLDGAEKPIGAG